MESFCFLVVLICSLSFTGEVLIAQKGASGTPMPPGFAHGTTIGNALSALRLGYLHPSDGIVGTAIYCFPITDEAIGLRNPHPDESLERIWERTKIGGYNRGAMFHIVAGGGILLTDTPRNCVVPPGTAAKKRGQFGLSSGIAQYYSVTFAIDPLVHHLDEDLDRLGYSQDLHRALMNAVEFSAGASPQPEIPDDSAVAIANTLVAYNCHGPWKDGV